MKNTQPLTQVAQTGQVSTHSASTSLLEGGFASGRASPIARYATGKSKSTPASTTCVEIKVQAS
ncbi:MAG: hypothetical protein ACKO24_04400 [Leptolyngbyaceae cyanobacterium]